MTTTRRAHAGARGLGQLLDVPLRVSVELGRTRMSIQELLALNNGAVVALDKLAGEPLDVYVGDKLVARGEAVVVNQHLGVRITAIVNSIAPTMDDLEETG